MKSILSRTVLSLGLLAGTAGAIAAQTGATQEGPRADAPRHGEGMRRGERGGRRHGKRFGRGHRGGMRGLRELNLTDAQKQQIRAIHERSRDANKAERDELRTLMQSRRQGGELTPEQQARAKELMQALRATHDAQRNEVLATLTPEQRAQIERAKSERKERRGERREEFRKRRQELRERRMQEAPKP